MCFTLLGNNKLFFFFKEVGMQWMKDDTAWHKSLNDGIGTVSNLSGLNARLVLTTNTFCFVQVHHVIRCFSLK